MVQPGELILNGKYRVERLLGRGAFGEVYLVTHLLPEVEDAAAEWLARHTVVELGSNLSLKEELAASIEEHLRPTLLLLGLSFDRVRAFGFRQERWDAIRRQREELSQQVSAAEAQAAGQQRLADVLNAAEVSQIAAGERANMVSGQAADRPHRGQAIHS